MNELLENLDKNIILYNKLKIEFNANEKKTLSNLLKEISTTLFFLEKYRSDYFDTHNEIIYTLTESKQSVSKALVIANKEVPELYMLRRIMTSGYKVLDAIRSNISTINKEN